MQPSSGFATSSSGGYSQDSFPADFTQAAAFKDPVKEAKEKMKQIEKKDKRSKRRRNDAKTAAEILIAFGIFNALMWTIPIFGQGWHKRMFTGFGIGFTQINTSLFAINVKVECHAMDWPFGLDSEQMSKLSPEHQICKIFKHMEGQHSLHSGKDLACAISRHACNIMEAVWYSGFFLIFAFAVSALISFIASMFLYYYWYQEHLKQIRNWARGLYCAAPVTGILAFCLYCIIMPDIGELPRSWTASVQSVNMGTGLGEIRSIGEDSFYVRYGWCWFFCFITMAFNIAAPIVWGFFFKRHPDEKQHEINAMNERMEIEEAIAQVEETQDYVESGEVYPSQYKEAAYSPPQYPPSSGYGPQSSDPYGGAFAGAAPQSGAAPGSYGYGGGVVTPYGAYAPQANPGGVVTPYGAYAPQAGY